MIVHLLGGLHENPYVGMFAFACSPRCFVVGLLLIPIGMWRRQRRLSPLEPPAEELDAYPTLDFNDPSLRASRPSCWS